MANSYSPVNHSISLLLLSLLALFTSVSAVPVSLMLHRTFPQHGMNLSHLREMDMKRHRRMLHSSVVNFSLEGTINIGLYYTTIYLGSPPREFRVQIDTGSDVSWVNCVSCKGCAQTSSMRIKLNYFDPTNSSTSSTVPCSHDICDTCSTSNSCNFNIKYEDDCETSGYYVSDLMHVIPHSFVSLVFGCSNLRTGTLASDSFALDGILGLGKQDMSLISQLYSQGKAPRIFSHCLKGDTNGGGILALGDVVEPNMSYTPLIPKEFNYNMYLESISVNGHILQIDPTIFMTSINKGAIIDSGTTMAYLIEGAYNPMVDAISRTIPQSVVTTDSEGYHCYLVASAFNVSDFFPPISLNFANHASLVLRPQDYLTLSSAPPAAKWCLAFEKSQDVTILGDIILKDKIFVYDLDNQRIGWTKYNCSMPLNVSIPSTRKNRSEKERRPQKLTMTMVMAFMTYMALILM